MTQPKTANSVRTIYLPQETIDLLIQEHAKHPGNPIMFPSPVTGNLYGPDCIGRLHKNLLKKAGITENIPFHGLRHTFASLFWRIEFLEIWFDPNKTHTGKIPGSTGLVGSVLPAVFCVFSCCF